ncbi:MAG TPA: glycosyltransferase 87 family protein [Nocardioidaceae bacterium]
MRRVRPVAAVVLAWVLTRVLVVGLLQGRHAWVEGDLAYFAASLEAVDERGLGATLVEYPLPGVVVVALPWLLATVLGGVEAYGDVVLVLSLAADAAFTAVLASVPGRGRWAALAVWLSAVPLLGATTYARFDLVPGVLAGVALLLLPRRPALAAAAGALATGLKLWPALVLPALAARTASRRIVLVVVTATGLVLAGGGLVAAGWGRLLSPLTWQAGRGLQIESVAATPVMVGWALDEHTYAVAFTEHNAFEVAGPGSTELLRAAEIGSLLALLGLVALWIAAFRAGRALTLGTVAWLALAAVGVFMVTSKVLSPQYLLWLLPLTAAAVALHPGRALRAWAGLLLGVTALTQLVFPELYGHLAGRGDLTGWAVLVLATRNVLLVVLVAWAVVAAVRGVSAAARSSASRPVRRGTSTAACGGGPTTRA